MWHDINWAKCLFIALCLWLLIYFTGFGAIYIKGGKVMPNLGERQIVEGRYWNTNGKGITVVAVITHGIDWAAYIGADDGWQESACVNWTAEWGAKLSAQDAKYFFPDIKLPYRR